MVSILKRMRVLKTLLHLRNGLGAAAFPPASAGSPAVTRMHLTYARKMYEGHMGARRFWRTCFPRIKYHNPGIGMTVKQIDDQSKPALLTVYFTQTEGKKTNPEEVKMEDSFAPVPKPSEFVKSIDVRNQQVEEIWEKLKAATGAKDMEISEADRLEMEENERLLKQSEVDRQRVASIRQAKKDQEAMLEAAKAEVEKQRTEQ